jgi:hypothetical protein
MWKWNNKPIKSVKKNGEGEEKIKNVIKGVNLIKVDSMSVWKYHKETPLHS